MAGGRGFAEATLAALHVIHSVLRAGEDEVTSQMTVHPDRLLHCSPKLSSTSARLLSTDGPGYWASWHQQRARLAIDRRRVEFSGAHPRAITPTARGSGIRIAHSRERLVTLVVACPHTDSSPKRAWDACAPSDDKRASGWAGIGVYQQH